MGFQVTTNTAALQVYNNLGAHQVNSSQALSKISSGLKASGGTDVASLGAATTLQINFQATQSAITDVQNAINTLRVADQIYAEAIALGQNGLEVANRAADANADTSATTAQLAQITLGIASVLAGEFNAGTVLGTALTPKVDATGNTLTVTPADTTDPAADTVAGYTTFVEAAIDDRAENAANLAVLQSTLQLLNASAMNEMAGVSAAQDTDIAQEMINLTSANIMTEAATAMLAQAMQSNNAILRLFQ
jgi:flagellin